MLGTSFNDKTQEALGIHFKRGTLYNQLLRFPKPKERYSYDWKNEHGKEVDELSPTVYEAIQYNVSCYLEAKDLPDFMAKRAALLAILSDPKGFILTSHTLGLSYKLRYIDSPSFNTLTPIWTGGKLYAEFTLTLENNYAPTINVFELADEESLIVTESGDQIYVEAYSQNF
ncbi:hypothetical protein [Sphingobacterium paludis]|uniref:Uncharacterized protein n=1 Tax=Sphingobacterium paludis TaxID=1476465 RepID=A0A4R7D3M1_9SPHI|nr:hypothetical protein [Sphingobacterium paludis]TDS14731.1 hypothetical protein B0I21_103230 [Sphingobacterium paludis]